MSKSQVNAAGLEELRNPFSKATAQMTKTSEQQAREVDRH